MYSTYQIYDSNDEKVNFQLDYYGSNTQNESFDAESLEKYQLYAVLWLKTTNGSIQVDFEDYEFEANTMLFLFPGQYFNITNGHFEIIRISFHRDFFCVRDNNPQLLCNGVLFNHVYAVAHTRVDPNSEIYFEQLHQEILASFLNPFHANELKIRTLLSKWLQHSVTEWNDQSPFSDKMTLEETDTLFLLKKTIDMNFLEKLSIARYADIMDVSEKKLSRLIKNRIGKTISELVNNRITLEAKRMLIFTDKSIKEIALDLSFVDVAYFVRFFKKYVKATPEGFRNRFQFDSSTEYFESIILLIEENYLNQHNVQFYADQLNITSKTLLDQVKKRWDCTVSDLIKKRLILESKRRLAFTESRIKEIANELHFSEPSAFSNFFKQHVGMSPEAFRANILANKQISVTDLFERFGTFKWQDKI